MRVSRLFVLFAAVLLLGAGCSSASPFAGEGGLFVTDTAGESWTARAILPTTQGPQSLAAVSVYRLFEDDQDPDAMYWASRAHGFFFTYNSGLSWQQAPAPLNTGFIFSIAVHPKNKCILFATNGTRVYKSVDCSRTFEEVHREERSGANITSLEVHRFEPYELLMSKANGDILLSSDQGISWTVVQRGLTGGLQIESDPYVADRLYLTTRNRGLWRTDDRGITWKNMSEGLDAFAGSKEFRRFVVDTGHEGHLYWISTYGILKSTDSGDTWEAIDLITSPGSAQIYGFAVNPENDLELYYTATVGGRSIFYHSIDGGINWTTESLPSLQLPTVLRIHPERTSELYLGMTIPPQN